MWCRTVGRVLGELDQRDGGLLAGAYGCVDRVVLNAYFSLGHHPGGFRTWWRRLYGSDHELDNTHLMRMAGRFARRAKAWGAANGVPVVYCKAGERKHLIAEQHLATHEVGSGVFLVLVAKAKAAVWDVKRSKTGVIVNIEKRMAFVNHYSFHIMDPEWGHVTIKMSGHPPFGAQVILNGHEHVACQAQKQQVAFAKEGNCFTAVDDPVGLAQIADALSQPAAIGRLSQVCQRWIYSACLCFALDADEQARSGFGYDFSVYQVEYSYNLVFRNGHQMQRAFDTAVDRARCRLDIPKLRTIFGARKRPHWNKASSRPPRLAAVTETPTYDLTIFKLHFGQLTVKAYTKGEHVLRFESIAHNTKALRCGRALDKFPDIVSRLAAMTTRFRTALDCVDASFVSDGALDELPRPSTLGTTRVGGIDLNKARARHALSAALALAAAPGGFTVSEFCAKVHVLTGQADTDYNTRQAAYDLRKLRGKRLVHKPGNSRRYHVPGHAARSITALLTIRDHVISPILAGVRSPRQGRKPSTWTPVDRTYEQIRINMQTLFSHLGITAA